MRGLSRIGLTAWLVAAALPLSLPAQAGDAEYGEQVLEMRGCNECHGAGGSARDLSQRPEDRFSPDALAATLWNHAPRMWEIMKESDIPHIGLLESDIANLYAYFYSLRHFDPEGDPGRGEKVFSQKGCSDCHVIDVPAKVRKSDADAAPPVDTWASALDPVLWLESMWNHGAEMASRIEKDNGDWPTFTSQEMVDLIAFIETRPAHSGKLPYLRMGDWFLGQHDFEALGCTKCHTAGDDAAGKVNLLELARREPLLSGLAVEMWNHRPAMAKQAEAQGMETPVFQPDQLANVLAYLFRAGYFQARGDRARGEEAYTSLGCATCHEGSESGAPALGAGPTPFSAIQLASSVWMHGPNMKAQMDYLEEEWPQLTEQQVADLVAFVRDRQAN